MATRGWEALGFVRLNDYAREQLGLSGRELQDLAGTDAALGGLPRIEAAFVEGRITWTKTRLLARVAREGIVWLDLDFLTNFPSRFPAKAGLKSALAGSLWLISLTAAFSIPVGVSAAIYLEEFARRGRLRGLPWTPWEAWVNLSNRVRRW